MRALVPALVKQGNSDTALPSPLARRALVRSSIVLMLESQFKGTRRVIDISGDGSNNQGRPVTAALIAWFWPKSPHDDGEPVMN